MIFWILQLYFNELYGKTEMTTVSIYCDLIFFNELLTPTAN